LGVLSEAANSSAAIISADCVGGRGGVVKSSEGVGVEGEGDEVIVKRTENKSSQVYYCIKETSKH
jgi:hypothetical protein